MKSVPDHIVRNMAEQHSNSDVRSIASELMVWRERIAKARDMCSPVYQMGDAETRRTLVAVYKLLGAPATTK
jgi:hypothetical protein